MFPILESSALAPSITRLRILAPRVARKQQPGQFVIVRVHDHGERIPLTIADADAESGAITLIVQAVGKTTRLLCRLQAGQSILDVVGPLGKPTEIRRFGVVVVVAGGVGAAIAWPIARAMQQAGNRVVFILGARSQELLILEDEIRRSCDELHVVTNDGSAGRRGLATEPLRERLESGEPVDLVFTVGPIPLMQAAAEVVRPFGAPIVASLNAIMVDGTGMCGGCRVLIGGRPQFACVDGPDFDALQVDFESLAQRNALYHAAERLADERFQQNLQADLDRVETPARQGRCAALEHAAAETKAAGDHGGTP